ncbi:cell wall protein DAN4-like [Vespa mandarinia]|uniref:cell wall protein DAN4-like n=1 Tax=Vespa mandarinia TaxID=7446 RepID=UPI00160D79C8|nr:cell wall protein DAN4-like [Vespa mandarinia]
MSARVLNPAMMTEMSRNIGGGRTVPSRAALARVRRDLFGPVDHAAARALAERELRAQSLLDNERWGFDFHLEIPKSNSRYEWEIVTANDVVPEPYALRGMPYLRKHAPSTPRKKRDENVQQQQRSLIIASTGATSTTTSTTTITTTSIPPQRTLNGTTNVKVAALAATTAGATAATAVVVVADISTTTTTTATTTMIATLPTTATTDPSSPTSLPAIVANGKSKKTTTIVTTPQRTEDKLVSVVLPTDELLDENTDSERTPPQRERSRIPEIGEITPNETSSYDNNSYESPRKKKKYSIESNNTNNTNNTTPVLPANTRKQSTITHFMKSRKRSLNGSTKGVIEPPEKVARNAGQIRS